jgi:hypothetical protein
VVDTLAASETGDHARCCARPSPAACCVLPPTRSGARRARVRGSDVGESTNPPSRSAHASHIHHVAVCGVSCGPKCCSGG